MLEQLRAWWEKCRGWLWEGAGQGGSILLDGLDGREGLEHALDDERTQLLEALDGLADEHQHVGRRRLVLVAQELDQLSSATHNSNYIMYLHTHVHGTPPQLIRCSIVVGTIRLIID